jgi:hypothetical protein
MGSLFCAPSSCSIGSCACFGSIIHRLEVAEVGEDSYRYVGNMGDLREKLKLNSRQTRISWMPVGFYLRHIILCCVCVQLVLAKRTLNSAALLPPIKI